MSDYNVNLQAVESAMDILDNFSAELEDLRGQVVFDITCLFNLVDREWDYYRDNPEKVEYIEKIKRQCDSYGQDILGEFKTLCQRSAEIKSDAVHSMGMYYKKLCRIADTKPAVILNVTDDRRMCIVDSRRYPITARHILQAQKTGMPKILTIERIQAVQRRRQSLAGVQTNRFYDRDEYPGAMFSRGGRGASVAYVERSDNRGAGASIRWQLANLPDGTQVYVRVV